MGTREEREEGKKEFTVSHALPHFKHFENLFNVC